MNELRTLSCTRILVLGLLAVTVACGTDTSSGDEEAAPGESQDELVAAKTWQRVYRHDFGDMHDVNAYQSGPQVNGSISPSDTQNSQLQKPTLSSNVAVVSDGKAEDGKSLAIFTRQGWYATPTGHAFGWTNGRMQINGQDRAPPIRIRTRIRMTASAKTKTAVMFWPNRGWPWEVDFAETFGGATSSDFWGGRQHIGQNWHGDTNGDGAAKEQLSHIDDVDMTAYHVFDLEILPSSMLVKIDGKRTFSTTDRRFIPSGDGHFSVGKALTGRRSDSDRSEDIVFVDWIEIYD